jgi:hypothetical protein
MSAVLTVDVVGRREGGRKHWSRVGCTGGRLGNRNVPKIASGERVSLRPTVFAVVYLGCLSTGQVCF